MGSDNAIVIKATARFQEADEPSRQRPIIRIDGAPPTIYQDFDQLPNTIRASIDSGRDNPFRPDGKIYKSADPIVDYYKFGPNQSRTNTPTAAESQLLLNGHRLSPDDNGSTGSSFLSRNWLRRKRKTAEDGGDRQKESKLIGGNDRNIGEPDRQIVKPCWRRWCCCCFCSLRCCKKKEQKPKDATDHNGKGQEIIPKTVVTIDSQQQQQVENRKRANDLALEIADSKRQLEQDHYDYNNKPISLSKSPEASIKQRQLKTTIVIDHYNSQTGENGTSAVMNTSSTLKPTNGHYEPNYKPDPLGKRGGARQDNGLGQDGPTGPMPAPTIHTTQVETTRSKKCIIS